MKISILIGIFVIFAIAEFTEAGFSKTCPTPRMNFHPEGICGSTLLGYTKTVCGIFKHGERGINKSKALGYVRSRRSAGWKPSLATWQPQNIICECCYNKCSILELVEYCWKKRERKRIQLFKKSWKWPNFFSYFIAVVWALIIILFSGYGSNPNKI